MNDFFVLLFLAALIWLVIDWRRSHKAGLKLQKRGKWLLVAVIALLVLVGMTAPADSDSKQQPKKETPKAKTSAKSSSQKKAETSSSSSQKKQDDGSSPKANQGQTNPAILAFTGQRQW